MPLFLRQSTASQEIPLGYFVDSTDGNTEETALTIANTDIKIWKTGATTLANKNSGGGTHISNGIYHCTLDATDTDTIGPLIVFVHVSGALTVRLECCVLDEAVYDSLFGTSALTTGGALTITSGRVNADVTHWLGTAAATPTVAGVPEVDITHIAGSAVNTSSAQLGVNVVNAAGTAWNSGAIGAATLADGTIDRATFAADTGLQSARSNTAQAGGSTSITLDASASATTDFYRHALIYLTGGTGVGQYRLCTAYNGTTKVATITPAWATNPDATSTFAVIPRGIANVEAFGGTAGTFSAGRAEVNTTHVSGTSQTAGDIIGDTNDIQSRLPAALAGGKMDSSVGAYQTGMTPLQPTVAGRTLDVSAGGEAGVDWANVGTPGSTVNLSATTVNLVNTLTTYTGNTPQTGDSFARIGVAGAGLTDLGGFSTAAKGQIQTEAEDALVVHRLDELLNADSDIDGAAPPTVGSVFHELLTKTTGSFTYDQTTDSLEAIRDRGDAAWTTGAGGTNPELLQNTTIATLASQTSFTLTAGSADDDAYNGSRIVVTDQATSTQKAVGVVLDYTGSTKTITLANDPAVFTMAVGDTVDILADRSLKPAVDNRTLNVTSGRADADLTHIVTAAVSTTTAQLGVNTVQAGGTAWGSGAITSASIATAALNSSKFNADTGFKALRQSTAQAGAASTITLDASASATDDFYNNCMIVTTSGTGSGQARRIRDYVGSTKVATITPNWATTPDNTTAFAIMPSTSAWEEVLADHLTSGTTGNALNAAGSAGDPWATALPGVYGAGTAGNILGNMTGGSASTLQTTTIATLASQTSFTLTAGSADNDAYNGCIAVVTDSVTASQKAVGIVLDYVGSTKTVTLAYDPAVFTMAAGDTIAIIADRALPPQVRKNTALNNFEFLMVDATDMKTEETGLTVTAARSIDGGAFASCTNSVSEVGNGIYKINLSAADLNGDYVTLRFTATGAATRIVPFATQPY